MKLKFNCLVFLIERKKIYRRNIQYVFPRCVFATKRPFTFLLTDQKLTISAHFTYVYPLSLYTRFIRWLVFITCQSDLSFYLEKRKTYTHIFLLFFGKLFNIWPSSISRCDCKMMKTVCCVCVLIYVPIHWKIEHILTLTTF